MSEQDTEASSRWQPILLILRNGGRLECQCGALAVVVIGAQPEQHENLKDVDYWCQACYLKTQAEESKE